MKSVYDYDSSSIMIQDGHVPVTVATIITFSSHTCVYIVACQGGGVFSETTSSRPADYTCQKTLDIGHLPSRHF